MQAISMSGDGLKHRVGRGVRRAFAALGYKLIRLQPFEELKRDRLRLKKEVDQQGRLISQLRAEAARAKAKANANAVPKVNKHLVQSGVSDILTYLEALPDPNATVQTLRDMFEDDLSRQTLDTFLKRLRALAGHSECREAQVCDVEKLAQLTKLDYEVAANSLSREQQLNHCAYGLYMLDDVLREALRRTAAGKVAIDGGAYDGETALMLLRDFGATHVHAFEPISIDTLLACSREHAGITPVHGGLFSEYRENVSFAYYDGSLVGATMLPVKKDQVELAKVYKLDDYVREHHLEVGSIKLDVEGAEFDVIVGAEQTIREQKPLLLISVYHRGKDLFEIPTMLRDWRPDYRFFMRHIRPLKGDRFFHTCEYVIYAV
jgi:FkbM family methyltransferase